MTVTVLITMLLVVVLLQPTRDRLYTAAIFAQVTFFHDALLGDIDSGWYYASAGAADVLIMILLLPVSHRCETAYRITHVAFVSMILNVLGWFLWYNFYEPTVYDASFIVLYVTAIITLLTRHGDNKHGGVDNSGMGGVRFGIRAARSPRRNSDSTCAETKA